jgi:hypothetical protein
VVINFRTWGSLARIWPEWLTIDSILNMSIPWICLQDSCFVQSLAGLLPNVTFLDYTPNMLVPSVDYIFCSHIMPSKTQASWSDSRLKAVFVKFLKLRYVVTGRWLCVPLELFHQYVGGSTDYQCHLRVFTPMVMSLEGMSVKKSTPGGVCSIAHDHNFGVEVQGQASHQHRTPTVWGTGKGVFHGDGLYPMSVTYNTLFVLRSCHSASKLCKRCLKREDKL